MSTCNYIYFCLILDIYLFYTLVYNKHKEVIFVEELKILKKTQPTMFTIRVDKTIVDFYDKLAADTNRSRNEVISMALEHMMKNIKIDSIDKD